MRFATLGLLQRTVAAGLVAACATLAQAGTIEVQLSGLNLKYDAAADTIVDKNATNSAAGGNHTAAEADTLAAAVFLVDSVVQSPPMASVGQYGDFSEALSATIADTTLLNPVSFGTTDGTGSAFGFEWFKNNSGGVLEYFLDLEFNQLTYVLTDNAFFLSGVVSSLAGQQLPYGLAFDPSQPITIAYQSTNFTKTVGTNGGSSNVNSIDASGQLTIAGTMKTAIPEPTALALLGSLFGTAVALRYRWK